MSWQFQTREYETRESTGRGSPRQQSELTERKARAHNLLKQENREVVLQRAEHSKEENKRERLRHRHRHKNSQGAKIVELEGSATYLYKSGECTDHVT
jgi:hypothetical protein